MQTQNTTQENFVSKNKKTLLIIAALIVLSKLFGGGNTDSVYMSGEGTNNESTSSSSSGGDIDQDVVGRWRMENRISSGGSGDYSSFTTVNYYQYNADGTYSITDGGAAGSFQSGNVSCAADEGATTGTWYVKDGYLYYTQDGEEYYKKYTMHNGKLVFGTNGNYTFLYPI